MLNPLHEIFTCNVVGWELQQFDEELSAQSDVYEVGVRIINGGQALFFFF